MNKNTLFITMLLLIGIMIIRSGYERDGFSAYMWSLTMYLVARLMTVKKEEERS